MSIVSHLTARSPGLTAVGPIQAALVPGKQLALLLLLRRRRRGRSRVRPACLPCSLHRRLPPLLPRRAHRREPDRLLCLLCLRLLLSAGAGSLPGATTRTLRLKWRVLLSSATSSSSSLGGSSSNMPALTSSHPSSSKVKLMALLHTSRPHVQRRGGLSAFERSPPPRGSGARDRRRGAGTQGRWLEARTAPWPSRRTRPPCAGRPWRSARVPGRRGARHWKGSGTIRGEKGNGQYRAHVTLTYAAPTHPTSGDLQQIRRLPTPPSHPGPSLDPSLPPRSQIR